jgi:plastocyanin
MTKTKSAGLLAVLVALSLPAGRLRAGDIVGALAVPRPDQAVVYVEKAPGTFHGGNAKMDQRSKVFIPYVLPVVQGTAVEFHNSDNLQHNVLGVGADKFNLGTYTQGMARSYTFNKLGEVAILCNVHPEMEAYILVLQNSYFTQLDGSGKFRIADVPPGDYVVKAWYRGKTKQQNVKVPAKGSVSVSF